ncbi:MAG TPA: TonB-dependent receptor, partial [Gemmatimonadaceae bacterium]|nr:TonB-dependent receptor [Gemmatimonadaceae bacterium]
SATCRLTGRASHGSAPLPGVSLVALARGTVVATTSTDPDGSYQITIAPGTYLVKAELTGFTAFESTVNLDAEPCAQTLQIQLALAPRTPRPPVTPRTATQAAGSRFETLNVQQQGSGAAADVPGSEREAASAAALLLPPGFSTDAPTESLAVTGTMASLDRGMMGDRLEAIGRGEFDPANGEFAPGFGRGGAGQGGPGGFGGQGGRGEGRGAGAGFALGGRGVRQNAYNAQATYNYGGSALDASPYLLRQNTVDRSRPYNRQQFGMTAGGPVKIPGLYDGTRRTNVTATYNGNRGDELFDQYGTVPSAALRSGDFSSLTTQLFDPATGLPFPGNQVPASRINPAALSLLRFIPAANLDGAARNYHRATTTNTLSDNVNVRLTHNLTPAAGRGRAGGRGAGGGGRAGVAAARGGRGQQGTSVTLNLQLQYRRNRNEQNNLFPALGGENRGSSLSVPIGLNIVHKRTMHNVIVNVSRTTTEASGKYAYVEDVAGGAGITGVATEPFDWGVPTLGFSSLTSVRDVAPSDRSDRRVTIGYTWMRPLKTHTLRAGGDVRLDQSRNRTDANARGAFTFTGLYSSGGSAGARGGGLDFADFLLGAPQQATLQYGPGNVVLNGRSMSMFIQDDWRRSAALTFNLGIRYELLRPFAEDTGRMVNLDVAPDFSGAAPVLSGETGPFTGRFPTTLIETDVNNIAPRVGVAWRAARATTLRGGYGISYNAGSYASIARQLVAQPPFAVTDTRIGTALSPLALSSAFSGSTSATTNNYGVARDYALGVVQTWNADLSRDFRQVWNTGVTYTHTRGSSLDVVRAPNRGPSGLRIAGVQPFLFQTSDGSSRLHAAAFRARRRPVKGIGFGATYTLARSRDNASTIGGGATVVAQDDRNLGAEWGLSSFDRRHQIASDVSIELPFGQNKPWLNSGGAWARLLENWRASAAFSLQSGTPYTPRVTGAAADVARGTSGTLRANYNGQPIHVNDPTIDLFFNTAAFSVPTTGTFGSASRNVIIGPGSRQLDAQFARDIRLGRTRVLSVNLTASNLLNRVNYAAIDTVVNSPTFGQVLSVRPMRSMQATLRFRF